MDIVAWLPNPEQDLKSPAITDGDFLISLVFCALLLIVFYWFRRKNR